MYLLNEIYPISDTDTQQHSNIFQDRKVSENIVLNRKDFENRETNLIQF